MESKWIWPFELLDKVGEGGMGVVYRARYVRNNKEVAVKLIPNEITADPISLARFERELDVLKKLRHPNIVHCFGGSCESKQRFYAMEFVPGGTLSSYMLKRGQLPLEKALDFAIQMCEALRCAHELGVVHRDVKPGNFLMTETGQLKLSDFGLAVIVSEGRLTAAGRTVGTILYMAPEQIRGEPATQQTDIYGLGCVIYEMIAGGTPYSGRNAAEVLQRHLKDPIPHIVRSVPSCPLELDELICEMLAKSPEQRPKTVTDVEVRLQGILLPGRRALQLEPSLFGSKSPKMVSTVAANRVEQSTADIPRKLKIKPPSRWSFILWIATILLTLASLRLWYGWHESSIQLAQAEQTWIELLNSGQREHQITAAGGLAKFVWISPNAVNRLREVATSEMVDLKLAAIAALRAHPVEAQPILTDLIKIQRLDENNIVRTEAGMAVDAIKGIPAPASPIAIALIVVTILVLAAGIIAFSRLWQSVKRIHN